VTLQGESAASSAQGIIILVAVTIILAALVLLMIPQLPHLTVDADIPVIFEIANIRHTDKNGKFNLESYMVVKNSGKIPYDNRKLYAKTYRNGKQLSCTIPSINFQAFIHNHPYGIETIGGAGTDNFAWSPGAMLWIDFNQGTFRPGDSVRFEVYNKETNQIISRDTYPHTEETNQEKMMKMYLSHQGV
jgi:hypothetical protein